jgi:WD40 repeat protein
LRADESYRYWAFISYSHRDRRSAVDLQRRLERYALPGRSAVEATVPTGLALPLRPVFVDDTELAASSDLTSAVRSALSASYALIVVCSRNAVASRWVDAEIAYFQSLGRSARVFSVLAGDPPAHELDERAELLSCVPARLAESEPLIVDLRDRRRRRTGLLRLVGGLAGLSLDRLVQRDRRRRRLRYLAVSAAAAVVGGVAVASAWKISAERDLDRIIAQVNVRLGEKRTVEARTLAHDALERASLWWSDSRKRELTRLWRTAQYDFGVVARGRLEIDQSRSERLAISADGTRAATPGAVTTISPSEETQWIELWNLASGGLIKRLYSKSDAGYLVALNRDGTTLINNETNDDIVMRDVESGRELARIVSRDGKRPAAAMMGNGRALLVWYVGGNEVQAWDAKNGRLMATVSSPGKSPLRRYASVENVKAARTVVVFEDGYAASLDVDDWSVKPLSTDVADVAGADEGNHAVLLLRRDSSLVLFDKDRALPGVVATSGRGVRSATVTAERSIVAVFDDRPDTVVFMFADRRRPDISIGVHSQINGIGYAEEGLALVVTTQGRMIAVFGDGRDPIEVFGGRFRPVTAAFVRDAGLVAIGTSSGQLLVMRTGASSGVLEEKIGSHPIAGLRLTEDGRRVVAVTTGGDYGVFELAPPALETAVREWSFRSGEFDAPDMTCPALQISAANDRFAVRLRRNAVRLWAFDGRPIAELTATVAGKRTQDDGRNSRFFDDEGGIFSFAFSPGGKYVAAVAADGSIWVWDAESGKEVFGNDTRPAVDTYLRLADMVNDDCSDTLAPVIGWSRDDVDLLVTTAGQTQAWNLTTRAMDTAAGTPQGDGPWRGSVCEFNQIGVANVIARSRDGAFELRSSKVGEPVDLIDKSGHVTARIADFPYVTSMCFSPNGSRFLLATRNPRPAERGASLYRIDGPTRVMQVTERMSDTGNLGFSPSGRTLILNARGAERWGFGDVYDRTELADAADGRPFADLTRILGAPLGEDQHGGMAEAKFSADGRHVIAVSYSGLITIWRLHE